MSALVSTVQKERNQKSVCCKFGLFTQHCCARDGRRAVLCACWTKGEINGHNRKRRGSRKEGNSLPRKCSTMSEGYPLREWCCRYPLRLSGAACFTARPDSPRVSSPHSVAHWAVGREWEVQELLCNARCSGAHGNGRCSAGESCRVSKEKAFASVFTLPFCACPPFS